MPAQIGPYDHYAGIALQVLITEQHPTRHEPYSPDELARMSNRIAQAMMDYRPADGPTPASDAGKPALAADEPPAPLCPQCQTNRLGKRRDGGYFANCYECGKLRKG